MSETITDDLVTLLPPLLRSLEALGFIARYFNPTDFDAVMEAKRLTANGAIRRQLQ